jgi:hypothetical protein
MSTYLQYYNENVAPKLQKIDLFLKTEESETLSPDIICELLDISIDEVDDLIDTYKISNLDKISFFIIMQNGSSEICKMFSREIQRKIPHFYSFYDISYIYQIPYEIVVDAAVSAGLNSITQQDLNDLFEHIIISHA